MMTVDNLQHLAFVILKPDAIRRRLESEILKELSVSFQVISTVRHRLTIAEAKLLYPKLVGTKYEERVVSFMTSGQSLLVVLRADEAQIEHLREIVGATLPSEAAKHTIRGRFCDTTSGLPNNLIHASDSLQEAHRELQIFGSYLKVVKRSLTAERSR